MLQYLLEHIVVFLYKKIVVAPFKGFYKLGAMFRGGVEFYKIHHPALRNKVILKLGIPILAWLIWTALIIVAYEAHFSIFFCVSAWGLATFLMARGYVNVLVGDDVIAAQERSREMIRQGRTPVVNRSSSPVNWLRIIGFLGLIAGLALVGIGVSFVKFPSIEWSYWLTLPGLLFAGFFISLALMVLGLFRHKGSAPAPFIFVVCSLLLVVTKGCDIVNYIVHNADPSGSSVSTTSSPPVTQPPVTPHTATPYQYTPPKSQEAAPQARQSPSQTPALATQPSSRRVEGSKLMWVYDPRTVYMFKLATSGAQFLHVEASGNVVVDPHTPSNGVCGTGHKVSELGNTAGFPVVDAGIGQLLIKVGGQFYPICGQTDIPLNLGGDASKEVLIQIAIMVNDRQQFLSDNSGNFSGTMWLVN